MLAINTIAPATNPADDPAADLVNALLSPGSGISVIDGSQVYIGAVDQGGTSTGFNASNPSITTSPNDGVILT